ncbi:DUF302 domain-containing protein [Cyanobium sp. Morenito 9A2]|uniref:DUF302 domain-containing protein n=1 Tax=Cyanobium sp. Morenito 9A2 TaxID=2823718 RepID=UPI0020CCA518|nr:DUF302 domain-containing protein [Cyanobium sp. Morenito 9A2]MCP9848505.1 DUF302 domain-containing protein [Cyanobium sp. Morenito 9A2]
MNPFFQRDTDKSFEAACAALEAAIPAHGFGLLAVHDLGATLRSKGLDFPEQCRVFEVCNPHQAAKVLRADINLATALPCRISVSRQDGRTRIAMVSPAVMLSTLSSDPELAEVARQVEATTIAIIEAAA